jgi:hypothetical protein
MDHSGCEGLQSGLTSIATETEEIEAAKKEFRKGHAYYGCKTPLSRIRTNG